ncbi:HAD domain-containing protein [Flavobacterium beibuense]|uniref:FCP1 homology domain-containing protein n=1 Tax=Flavobacterium beibuense TaxID=657326 RepID=A0A444WFF5_9FLAO|nr:HAD domain-containing protein [Flavobacterium beibuense]RYJ44506.1 hypothetical protein NU09_1116 [Flavobacterium beibuense]
MLVLLDIDGVMLHASPWKKVEMLEDGFSAFSKEAVKSLNKILEETKASIILTTSHKYLYSIKQWEEMFELRGITASITRLEETKLSSRKEEVLYWINNNPKIDNYVIIDDDKSLNGLPPEYKERLVITNSITGLTMEYADKAISILKSHQL